MDDTKRQSRLAKAERDSMEQFKPKPFAKRKMLTKGSFKYKIFMRIINVLAAHDVSITGENLQIHHGGKSYIIPANTLPKNKGEFYKLPKG